MHLSRSEGVPLGLWRISKGQVRGRSQVPVLHGGKVIGSRGAVAAWG